MEEQIDLADLQQSIETATQAFENGEADAIKGIKSQVMKVIALLDEGKLRVASQESGDWVTARINGVFYFDKPPGQVWAMAASFAVFGVHDWAARIPLALACVALAWVTWRFGRWSFGSEGGLCGAPPYPTASTAGTMIRSTGTSTRPRWGPSTRRTDPLWATGHCKT